MKHDLDEYKGALKYIFSKACGGQGHTKDWDSDAWMLNDRGQLVCDFKNAAANLVHHVISEGQDAAGNHHFRVDNGPGNQMTMAVPSDWKNLKI